MDQRFATELMLPGLVIVGVHYPWQITASGIRAALTKRLVERVSGFNRAVICGDFNSYLAQNARRQYAAAGYISTSAQLARREIGYPVNYQGAQLPLGLGNVLPRARLDDIYTRGLDVPVAAGVPTLSDHPILMAMLGDYSLSTTDDWLVD